MDKKLVWSQLKTSGLNNIGLTFGEFVKILDCYYGSIFITDGDGILLYFNEAYYASIGLSRGEHLGKHVNYLQELNMFSKSPTLECLNRREKVIMEISDKTGRNLLVHAVPIFDDNNNIMFTVHFAQHETSISFFIDEIKKNKAKIQRMYNALAHITKRIDDGVDMVYKSNAMEQLCNLAQIIAKTDGTVILYGQSGTGKEVLARYIYKESNRADEIFIPVNCAAIPSELIESELFGYMPGAFTGAKKEGYPGLFELANKGTLFLDEIGELPIDLQSKLLRVLESGEVRRLGATSSKKINVRIITATNRNLKEMIANKTFREDLYYRLNVIPITIPSLKDRLDDIEVLANYFLETYNKKYGYNKKFSAEALDSFQKYAWPGNIRELKNLIHRLVIITQNDLISNGSVLSSLSNDSTVKPSTLQQVNCFRGKLKDVLEDYEFQYIVEILQECNGNVTQAADKLGVHRSFIYRKLGSRKPKV